MWLLQSLQTVTPPYKYDQWWSTLVHHGLYLSKISIQKMLLIWMDFSELCGSTLSSYLALIRIVARKRCPTRPTVSFPHTFGEKNSMQILGGAVSFLVQTTFEFFRMFLCVTSHHAHALLLGLTMPKMHR